MKFGFVTAILPELSFDNVLNFALHEGFSTVEVMCWPVGKAERKYAGVTHIDVTSLTKTKAQEILGHSQDQGVSISALGYYPNMLDPDAEVSRTGVAHFKKVIAAAASTIPSTRWSPGGPGTSQLRPASGRRPAP